MTDISRPAIDAIKARLGSLAPGKLSAIAEAYPVVGALLIDCKHLVAYVEQSERALPAGVPHLIPPPERERRRTV